MKNKPDSNDLFLEILAAEIEAVILNSEKIQSRFRQISNMRILEDIADQTIGVNLGDLANAFMNDMDIKKSLSQREEEKKSLSECQELVQRATNTENEEENNGLDQRVDGKKLSLNEIRFQEYLEKTFDEDKWLQKVKIDYPEHRAK